ncbi:MAG TPA: cation transporter [Bacteroidales bacterium]|jgi:cobalt-zinc-cadmium efflux system protein|nr:cation transporter [Bacteroidales bacterium]
MAHSHGHGHGHTDLNGRNLLFATVLNLIITIVEIIGGILSNSLALLSDAIHNLGDTIAVLLAWAANKISKRAANSRKTFGYKRAEILAALFNAATLIVIIFFLFREAIVRFQNPEPIKGLLMFGLASIGLLANLLAVLLLRKDSNKNINIKAAYLHLLGDTVSSVAVIIGSVLIYFYKVYWLDPVLTILIGIYILKETYSILRQSVDILMQATPKNVDLETIQQSLENIQGIDNIHHLHIWNLNDSQVHFECHADVADDIRISETEILQQQIESILHEKFEINHVTIQFEYNCCSGKELIKHHKH